MSQSPTGLQLYDAAGRRAAAVVIRSYSTSFGMATRLLGARPRPHVRNIYALVRVADEIVDGPAAEAGVDPAEARRVLDDLETETVTAIERGFSSNLIVHAFAATARECGIDESLIAPFFAAMRTDLATTTHDGASHDSYVFGSAEVVGLMCLRVFVNAGRPGGDEPDERLTEGARRLGSAFQDVNFLRDLDDDRTRLGRDYLAIDETTNTRTDILARIEQDLEAARLVIAQLPADCRRAVTAAHDLFAELAHRLRAEPVPGRRVRVPDAAKAVILARACLGRPAKRRAA
ncbi:squalene/phytoene synthase family protein [Microbacterium sediminicola]|uniref:Squalene/phytoene synthase family protein n=1 Tax=Microbacterium sediminicola TaxID=415210 RepID=A0ABP4TP39_9MICO